MGWYDIAQVCRNGHVINRSTRASPEFNRNFCAQCGTATLTQCVHCKADIPGHYHDPGLVFLFGKPYPPPAFCSDCGSPYPWTESKLRAAKELANELDNLSASEKESLSTSFDDLVKDNPNTPLAATRFKKLAAKGGKEALTGLRDILVDIASETAKKLLWPTKNT